MHSPAHRIQLRGAGGETRPLTVRDVRVAAAVGSRLRDELSHASRCQPIDDRAGRADLVDGRPHLVLVELSTSGAPPPDRAEELLEHAREIGVPSAVWLTDLREPDASWAELLARAGAVFATDPGLGPKLVSFDGRAVIGLPDAACHGALEATPRARGPRIGVIVDGARTWRDQSTPRLERLLDATAAHPLAVLVVGRAPADLPPRLAGAAEPAGGEGDRVAFIARCGALVAASPRDASELHTPAVAFDAAALGTPVIMPAKRGAMLTLPRFGVTLPRHEDPGPVIAAALERGEVLAGRRAAGRIAVRREHTYAHRLATITSLLRWPVMVGAPS